MAAEGAGARVLTRGPTAAQQPRPAQAQRQSQHTSRRLDDCQPQREGQQQAGVAGHCCTRFQLGTACSAVSGRFPIAWTEQAAGKRWEIWAGFSRDVHLRACPAACVLCPPTRICSTTKEPRCKRVFIGARFCGKRMRSWINAPAMGQNHLPAVSRPPNCRSRCVGSAAACVYARACVPIS
jgi:hypothetical protein